MSLYSFNYLLY